LQIGWGEGIKDGIRREKKLREEVNKWKNIKY
jgi:hypothetical protein